MQYYSRRLKSYWRRIAKLDGSVIVENSQKGSPSFHAFKVNPGRVQAEEVVTLLGRGVAHMGPMKMFLQDIR
jgi:hypothetical protein